MLFFSSAYCGSSRLIWAQQYIPRIDQRSFPSHFRTDCNLVHDALHAVLARDYDEIIDRHSSIFGQDETRIRRNCWPVHYFRTDRHFIARFQRPDVLFDHRCVNADISFFELV